MAFAEQPNRPRCSGLERIVGMVGNIHTPNGPRQETSQIHQSYLQFSNGPEMLFFRCVAADAHRLASALRLPIWSLDPDQPTATAQTIFGLIKRQQGVDSIESYVVLKILFAALVAAIGVMGARKPVVKPHA